MKCRLDGPASPADVALHRRCAAAVTCTPSPFCHQVQREYMRLFGSAPKGCRTELPRKVLAGPEKPGLPKLKRKRDEQMTQLRQAEQVPAPKKVKEELLDL